MNELESTLWELVFSLFKKKKLKNRDWIVFTLFIYFLHAQ